MIIKKLLPICIVILSIPLLSFSEENSTSSEGENESTTNKTKAVEIANIIIGQL